MIMVFKACWSTSRVFAVEMLSNTAPRCIARAMAARKICALEEVFGLLAGGARSKAQ